MSAGRFPQRIKRGSCVVTIYKTPTKGYDAFTVVHYDASGARCRRMFASYVAARKAAKETAAGLAAGKPEVHVLTGHELVIYRRALKALYPTGTDLDAAAGQFAQAAKVLGDVSLVEAVNVYNARRQPQVVRKMVPEVVDELLAVKRSKGRSFLYLKDLRCRLARVAKAFVCPLGDMTSDGRYAAQQQDQRRQAGVAQYPAAAPGRSVRPQFCHHVLYLPGSRKRRNRRYFPAPAPRW